MTCPYLEYRTSDDRRTFATNRPYCTAADRFVQPMRADICNDRYDLAHDRDCEIYRVHGPPFSLTNSTSSETESETENETENGHEDESETEDGERSAGRGT